MGAAFSNAISSSLDWITGSESAEKPKPLTPIQPEIKIVPLWDEKIGQGDGGKLLALTVASAGGAVFAADHRGRVVALRLQDGQRLFEVETGRPLAAGPALGDGAVLLGTQEGEVLALAQSSGKTLWTAQVSSEVLAPPAVDQGVVVVHSGDETVFAFSVTQGKLIWSFGQHSVPLSLRGVSPPTILGNKVLIGFGGGRMAWLNLADGKVIWEKPLVGLTGTSELEQVVDIDSRPAVDDEAFYVTANYGGVIAAGLSEGDVLWRNERIVAHLNPAVASRRVFVTDSESHLWGLDKTTGRAYWKQTELRLRQATAPVPYGPWLVVGDYQGYVHFLAQEDGRIVGRHRVAKSPIRAEPQVAGDVLLVLASDGTLSALKIE
nr:outer membrane assembly lipoprotein YfgL [uncultured Gammaproteobacteria bacterium]